GQMAERRCDRPLPACVDVDALERELLTLLGERPRGRRQSLPLGQRLLEREEALARQRRPRLQVLLLAARRARRGVRFVGRTPELRGVRAARSPPLVVE